MKEQFTQRYADKVAVNLRNENKVTVDLSINAVKSIHVFVDCIGFQHGCKRRCSVTHCCKMAVTECDISCVLFSIFQQKVISDYHVHAIYFSVVLFERHKEKNYG